MGSRDLQAMGAKCGQNNYGVIGGRMASSGAKRSLKQHTITRDGDRDIVFRGSVIGEATSSDDMATIYRTESGKYVAALMEKVSYSTHRYSGTVADDAEGIAAFFQTSIITGDGKTRTTRIVLNEAGKQAMQAASEEEETFRDKGYEIVD